MSASRLIVILLLALFGAESARAETPSRAPDRILTGSVTDRDHQHYLQVPFAVPPGTARIVVAFDHDQRAQKTVIDLGVEGQHGFRGSSGGDKADFTIGESDATPSYLPGRIEPGRWRLVLAVPNIRRGVTAHWTARLWFLKAGAAAALPSPVVDRGPGWYRGALHLHTAHSDGSCASQSGRRVPCPLFKTLETAAARGLDFVAITDHNTTSAYAAMREAAPYFDRLLLIPGREITTFYGHFNIFGVTEPIDNRITPDGSLNFNAIADRVHAAGGLVSINHPALPSGEACMGCGWSMASADLARVDAVEVVNGGTVALQHGADGPFSGVPFWLRTLAKRGPVTAIGGSDNHDGSNPRDVPGTVGRPTTIVYANGLTVGAILAGLRAGRVFIDVEPVAAAPASFLDLKVSAGDIVATMGGKLRAGAGATLSAQVTVVAPAGSRLELIAGDEVIATVPVDDRRNYFLPIVRATRPLVVRAVVRRADGALSLIGNAVVVTD